MSEIFPGEDEDLKLHSHLCAERYEGIQKNYQRLESRIDKIEQKIDGIFTEIKANKTDLTKVLIGATTTILAGLLGLITTILMKF